jgi:hypothetical protein
MFHVIYTEFLLGHSLSDSIRIRCMFERERERETDCNIFLYYNILVNKSNAGVVMFVTSHIILPKERSYGKNLNC